MHYLLLSISLHSEFYLCIFWSLQSAFCLIVGNDFAYEWFSVYRYDFISGNDAGTLCRTIFHYILNMYGVLAYGKLNSYA